MAQQVETPGTAGGSPRVARGCHYLYAIVAHSQGCGRYGPIGIEGSEVYSIIEGPLAAVVSDVPNARLRPERRHMAAHHAVHKRLMQEGALLPMSFGVLAEGPDAVRRILTLNRDAFVEQLRRVESNVEMSLVVKYDIPNIFEYFVRTHPELRAFRDQLFGGGRQPSEDDKIELGRLFDRLLGDDRAELAQQVVEVLAPLCAEIKENPSRGESGVMNLACLVARDGQERFERGVFEAAGRFDDDFSFDYSGPWPPYNFVDVHLRT
jgi:hypothetical protein